MASVLSVEEAIESLQKIECKERCLYVGICAGARTLIIPIVSVEEKSFEEVGGSFDIIHRKALVTVDAKTWEQRKIFELRNILDSMLSADYAPYKLKDEQRGYTKA